MEYTCLALGWVLLLVELPQPASSPAKPIRISMDSRFIILAYRIVIQTGFEPAARLTEGGLRARSLPMFWSTANSKILGAIGFVSSTYIALLDLETATKLGVVQPTPQSNGDAVETPAESEPSTSVGSPVVVAMRKTEILCEPWLAMNRKRLSWEV